MLETTAGKKKKLGETEINKGNYRNNPRWGLQHFTQFSVPAGLGCDSLSPWSSQGSCPSLLLQSLALSFVPHLSLSSSSLLFLTYWLTPPQSSAHPFLSQSNLCHKYYRKPIHCDFLSWKCPDNLHDAPSCVCIYMKCKTFGVVTTYPFMSMSCLVQYGSAFAWHSKYNCY